MTKKPIKIQYQEYTFGRNNDLCWLNKNEITDSFSIKIDIRHYSNMKQERCYEVFFNNCPGGWYETLEIAQEKAQEFFDTLVNNFIKLCIQN